MRSDPDQRQETVCRRTAPGRDRALGAVASLDLRKAHDRMEW